MFRLEGKVALITGGSRGIGRACAEALAKQGASVVVSYVKGEAAARATVEAIVAAGGKADAIGFDVADPVATEAAIEATIRRQSRMDILVANAGIAIDGLLLRVKPDDLDRQWATNVKGAITCAKACMKTMMRARGGRIVFVSSVVAEMGNVGQTGYAATKAALLGVTKSIAREYASRAVTVNAIAPGFIETDMTAGMNPEMKAKLLEAIPLGHMGSPRDVASACVYLASDEAGYVTGQVLRVNGGLYV